MKGIRHESNNRVLGVLTAYNKNAPLPIDALPVTDATLNGQQYVTSYWEPTAEEIEALTNGKLVRLWLQGKEMPVAGITVE